MGPEDVDLIHVYDGFSPMVPMWLEAFQFAPRGEGLRWMQGGTIAPDGPHPMNTSGGNLGEGRIHGFAHVYETAIQMMGRDDESAAASGHLVTGECDAGLVRGLGLTRIMAGAWAA